MTVALVVVESALLASPEGLLSLLLSLEGLLSLLSSLLADEDLSASGALADFLLSVIYQPLPLKITPTGWKMRRIGPCPQFMHSVMGSAVIGCTFSNRVPHDLHSYSYTGIYVLLSCI